MEGKGTIQPINLLEIARLLWDKRKFIAKVCFALWLVTTIYVYSLPRYYAADVSLAPETSNSTGISGSISSLASMAGVNLGNESDDAIYPMIYPDIVTSNQFLVELFDIRVRTIDGHTEASLYEYLTRHQKEPWWVIVTRPVKNFMKKLKSQPVGPSGDGKVNPFWLSKKDDEVCKYISGCMTCQVDKKTDVISLSFRAQDPLVAATMVDSIREHLQMYITSYRTAKARNDLEYAEHLQAEARIRYEAAQNDYAAYCDSHQNTILQAYISQQESLENELQLAYNEYTQLSQQVQMGKAKVQERTPAFAIVKCATVPLKPSSPKRLFSMLGSLVLGFIFASVYVYARQQITAT